jgi:hypothetical protein
MNSLPLSHLCLAGISALCLIIAPVESAGLARAGAFVPAPVRQAGALVAMRPPQTTPNAGDWVAIGSDINERGPVLWQLGSQSLRSNARDGDALLSLSERVFYSGRYGAGDIVGSESSAQDMPDEAFAQSTLGAREDTMLQALCRERPTAHLLA